MNQYIVMKWTCPYIFLCVCQGIRISAKVVIICRAFLDACLFHQIFTDGHIWFISLWDFESFKILMGWAPETEADVHQEKPLKGKFELSISLYKQNITHGPLHDDVLMHVD